MTNGARKTVKVSEALRVRLIRSAEINVRCGVWSPEKAKERLAMAGVTDAPNFTASARG